MAMAVTGIIAAAASASVYQIMTNNTRNVNHMVAVKQVENALLFLMRDIQMAQTVQTTGLPGDEKLKLAWVDWGGTPYEAVYSLDPDTGELTRDYSAGGTTTVSHYIADLQPVEGDGEVTVTITSTYGHPPRQSSETREVHFVPRTGA
jgi:type II secretory pathway pseudopilin PulG